jgi:hypothetical protein
VPRPLIASSNPGRSPGADEIAGFQGHELRQVVEEEENVERHRPRIAVLAADAVHAERE